MALLLFGGSLVSAQQSFFVSEVANNTCNSIFIKALVQKPVLINKDFANWTTSLFLSFKMHTYVREDMRNIQISENTNNNNL